MSPGLAAAAPHTRRTLTACPICGGARLFYQFSLETFRIVRCHDCGLMGTNPQPDDAELTRLHGTEVLTMERSDVGQEHVAELHQATADGFLDLIARYGVRPGARLLEIGCGRGDFLRRAAARGYAGTGVEFSAQACAIAREAVGDGAEILLADAGDLSTVGARYDLCVLSDVVEHVRDPRALLAQAHGLLKPGGVLMLAAPSLDSFPARLLRNRWAQFRPEHLWYFMSATLETLLCQTGFGGIIQQPGVQTLSFDYIAGHFERYPVPWISPVTGLLRKILPASLARHPLRTPSSYRVFLARRREKTARPTLSVIVPAYNEAATFDLAFQRLLAKEIEGVDLDLIVVESHSTDGTRDLVARYADHPRVTVVWEDRPSGKGHAVRAGLARAHGDYVLIQDADLEYDLEDYEALLEPLLGGRAAFVLGARHGGVAWKMRQFTGQPILSAVMNTAHRFFTFLVNALFGARMRDPFTMFKVFRRDCLHGLRFECDRFDFDFELVIKLLQKGYQPLEIPVNYRSRSFAEGKKVSFLRDPLTWLRALAKFRLSKVNPLEEVARQQRAAVADRPGCRAAIS